MGYSLSTGPPPPSITKKILKISDGDQNVAHNLNFRKHSGVSKNPIWRLQYGDWKLCANQKISLICEFIIQNIMHFYEKSIFKGIRGCSFRIWHQFLIS